MSDNPVDIFAAFNLEQMFPLTKIGGIKSYF